MNLEHLLSRADDQALQELIGSSTMRLLLLLDPELTTPSRLRELILEAKGVVELLLSKPSREILLDLLPPNDAKLLAGRLSPDIDVSAYAVLRNANFRSKRQKAVLFEFFGAEEPKAEAPQEVTTCKQITPTYELFDYQRHAARKAQFHIAKAPYRVLLHMPTGAGKTRTAMNVIAEHFRQREPCVVIWLAFSEELCEQAAIEFEKAWVCLGNRKIDIVRFWGKREYDFETLTDGIVIAGLSKLYNALTKNLTTINILGKLVSLVIIDEAHTSVADTYKLILDSLMVHHSNTALLGLSATPGRTWDQIAIDARLAEFFAKQKVTLEVAGYDNPIEYLVDEGYLARVQYAPLFHGGATIADEDLKSVRNHFDIPEHILKRLANDVTRNLAIIGQIEKLIHRHPRILVFAATVDHATLLASVLQARGHTSFAITSNTPVLERERLINRFKSESDETMILSNYGVLTTGFDAPRTNAALIARPTKSLVLYTQMIGRVIRGPKAGGSATAEVITVVDSNLPGFGSIFEAFNNWEDVWE